MTKLPRMLILLAACSMGCNNAREVEKIDRAPATETAIKEDLKPQPRLWLDREVGAIVRQVAELDLSDRVQLFRWEHGKLNGTATLLDENGVNPTVHDFSQEVDDSVEEARFSGWLAVVIRGTSETEGGEDSSGLQRIEIFGLRNQEYLNEQTIIGRKIRVSGTIRAQHCGVVSTLDGYDFFRIDPEKKREILQGESVRSSLSFAESIEHGVKYLELNVEAVEL